MKTSIDTIRESLDKAIKNLCYYDGFDNDQWEKALAALSTIDPDAKPKESSEDVILEARKFAEEIVDLYISRGLSDYYNKASATILAHDDAIRRECAEKNCEVCEHEYEQTLCGGTIKNPRRPDHCKFRAAILATEPAREIEDSGCAGCKYAHEYYGPCWNCTRSRPVEIWSINHYEAEPAREES